MAYLYLKALHIIFIVTWFSGLFYIVRLFIYHTEAAQKSSPEKEILTAQYKVMAKRLWYMITWPSAIITLILGLSLLHYYVENIPVWLWVKLLFVLGLVLYQLYCHKIFADLQKDKFKLSSQQLRVWNEVSTVFLISIVFLVILKNTLSMVWGMIGLFLLMTILMLAIRIYKKVRKE